MQVTGLLVFFIIHAQKFLSNAESKHSVIVMNDLFDNTGWSEWHRQDSVRIFDHRNNSEIVHANDLLAPMDIDGRIVTDENVEHKIRQAHLFLSCKYVRVLEELCEYQKGIGLSCTKTGNTSEARECLRISLRMLKESDLLVMCMLGPLSCLQTISTENNFDKRLFDTLDNLNNFYRLIKLNGVDSIAEGNVVSTIVKQVEFVNKKILETLKSLSDFYEGSCYITLEGELDIITNHASTVRSLNGRHGPVAAVQHMEVHMTREIIEKFIGSFDERFGFKFDSQSKSTVLTYDSALLERVKRMNELLGDSGWQDFNREDIIWNTNEIASSLLNSIDGRIVTKSNVDGKAREAYRLLSCNYAVTLKRFCEYAKLIWKQCSNNREDFVSTMMKSEPLISTMRNALWYLHHLSSYTVQSRDVPDLFNEFSDYFKFKVFKKKSSFTMCFCKSSDSKTVKSNLDIENDMSRIINILKRFHGSNCFGGIEMNINNCSNEEGVGTSSSLIDKFNAEIDAQTLFNNNAFRFLFGATGE